MISEPSSTHSLHENDKRIGYFYHYLTQSICVTQASIKVLNATVQVRTRRRVNDCVCVYRSVTNYRNHSTYLYIPFSKEYCVYQRVSDTTVVNHTAVVYVHGGGNKWSTNTHIIPKSIIFDKRGSKKRFINVSVASIFSTGDCHDDIDVVCIRDAAASGAH